MGKSVDLNKLKGMVISSVTGMEEDSYEIVFNLECGSSFTMTHHQDCCEDVSVSDVCGDKSDLINARIVHFECRESDASEDVGVCESGLWTFYDIQTNKGYVNIRWLGVSNGYYSESVDVDWVKEC